MPALVKRRLGEFGSRLAEGTIVCRFSRKKSKKDCLISEAFMMHHQFCFSRILIKAEPRRCAKNRRSSSRSSQSWSVQTSGTTEEKGSYPFSAARAHRRASRPEPFDLRIS